jgi:hypothetical protein
MFTKAGNFASSTLSLYRKLIKLFDCFNVDQVDSFIDCFQIDEVDSLIYCFQLYEVDSLIDRF